MNNSLAPAMLQPKPDIKNTEQSSIIASTELPRYLTANQTTAPKLVLHTSVPSEVPTSESLEVENIVVREFDDLPNSPDLVLRELGDAPVIPMIEPNQAIAPSETPKVAGVANIPAGWKFNGNISVHSDITLACHINGDVTCLEPNAHVVLTQTCVSTGKITGRDILIQGRHTGSIDATSGRVCIEQSARISGDMTYSNITMNGGAHNITMKYVEPVKS